MPGQAWREQGAAGSSASLAGGWDPEGTGMNRRQRRCSAAGEPGPGHAEPQLSTKESRPDTVRRERRCVVTVTLERPRAVAVWNSNPL